MADPADGHALHGEEPDRERDRERREQHASSVPAGNRAVPAPDLVSLLGARPCQSPPQPTRVEPALRTVLGEWGRIGCVGFGGPPAHVALLRELCVRRRRWLGAADFEDALAACGMLPGPASTQLAIYCAWRVRGRAGGLVGGLAFVLPGLVLPACGLLELLARRRAPAAAAALAPWPLLAAAAGADGGLPALAWVALEVGALSYGGGFVIVPLMQDDAVDRHGWLSPEQFLDAVALGQVTPGPVVHTVAAVGYAAAGRGGRPRRARRRPPAVTARSGGAPGAARRVQGGGGADERLLVDLVAFAEVVQIGKDRRSSAELLGEPDEKSFRSADVAEPICVFVLDHVAADELRAVLAEPGERLVDVVHGEHDPQVAEGVDRCVAVIGDHRRREKARELEPAVAVRRAHHGDLDSLVAQPGHAPCPLSFHQGSPFELQAELAKELDRRCEVLDDDANVVHPFERHGPNLQCVV